MLTCMYCGVTSHNYEMFVVREAVKPPFAPNRWLKIGLCCEGCEAKGKPTAIDKWRKP